MQGEQEHTSIEVEKYNSCGWVIEDRVGEVHETNFQN